MRDDAGEDQAEVIDFLSRPEAYGAGTGAVERIDTHISVVFLVGKRAFKLMRAVRTPYLDFSTPELRRADCEAEVTVNRRAAPGIYRGVIAVTRREDGALRLGGDGRPVDWLVEMRRFDENTLFDRLARRRKLNRDHMEDLAEAIAGFHRQAETCPRGNGRAVMTAIVDSNALCFAAQSAGETLDMATVERLDRETRRALEAIGGLLEARHAAGFVRRCHGDLHLGNICLIDGRPTLFDAIEFSRALTGIDVLYDLAFLLMDLDHRGQRRLANIAFNRYLDLTGHGGAGLAALPLFLSVRAAVRAHVNAAGVRIDQAEADGRRREARGYLERALGYLSPPPPRLVAVGGLSGSGKSRMGRELAPFIDPAPGALTVRSDVVRKRLAGVHPLTRLGPEGYTAEMTERTYRALLAEARTALEAGHSVIADAVFARPDQRAAVAGLAAEVGVPFAGLWIEAPPEVREERVAARRRNVSDATAEEVRRQLSYVVGRIDWHRIDSSGPRERTLAEGIRLLDL